MLPNYFSVLQGGVYTSNTITSLKITWNLTLRPEMNVCQHNKQWSNEEERQNPLQILKPASGLNEYTALFLYGKRLRCRSFVTTVHFLRHLHQGKSIIFHWQVSNISSYLEIPFTLLVPIAQFQSS